MKYYSDVTKQVYETERDCLNAEELFFEEEAARRKAAEVKKAAEKKKQEERATDAKVVEQKREAMIRAQKDYYDAIDAFTKKHGSYHFSTNSANEIPHLFTSFFDFIKTKRSSSVIFS